MLRDRPTDAEQLQHSFNNREQQICLREIKIKFNIKIQSLIFHFFQRKIFFSGKLNGECI